MQRVRSFVVAILLCSPAAFAETIDQHRLPPGADRDGAAGDPSPNPLAVMPTGSNFGLTDQPVSITFRLVDQQSGQLMTELTGVRATLTVGGSAVFGNSASQGLLVSGGGTNRVLVEFVQGLVTLAVVDAVGEIVVVGGEDTEHHGIGFPSTVHEDFEADNGSFIPSTDFQGWNWGPPSNGPGYAASGVNAWGIDASSGIDGSHGVMTSPWFTLAAGSSPRLEFQNWFYASESNSYGSIDVSRDGVSWTSLAVYQGNLFGYSLKSYDLSSFAGSVVQVRYSLSTFRSFGHWYIDDFAIEGAAKTVEFLSSPGGDIDGDGLTNADEVARGTNPRDPDTDHDDLSDAAEVNLYGTDPLNRDTDGGSTSDGDEIYQRTDPLDPSDDRRPEYGMVAQTFFSTVLDSHTRANLGNVYLGYSGNSDCVISPDGRFGYATDSDYKIWVVDPTSTPPALASPTNPIGISSRGGDLAATADGRFLVTCGYPSTELSIVEAAARAEVGTFNLGTACSAVDVCRDGSILVTSYTPSVVRRLVIDGQGQVSDTGEVLSVSNPSNVNCSPDAGSGVVMTSLNGASTIRSFRIPGLAPVSQRSMSGVGAGSGVMAHDGTRYYARSNSASSTPAPGKVEVFAFDQATATLGTSPLFTLEVAARFGFDMLALDYEGNRLYVPEYHRLRVFDAGTGAALPDLPATDIQPSGICFRSPTDRDGDGLGDDDETALGTDPDNPDTDGDGLLDGFEAKYGFDPLVPGEQAEDPDGDGLDNLAEQLAHTNPTSADTDGDGLGDREEIEGGATDPRDPDSDDDGVLDGSDNCPTLPNAAQTDRDLDGTGDACDNCSDLPNPDQSNMDGDSFGDVCDPCPHVLNGFVTDLVQNGGFETGDFTHWTVEGSTNGIWIVNRGTADAPGPSGTLAPIAGQFDALTIQNAPGRKLLSQTVSIPSHVQQAVLSWSDRVLNYATVFQDPGQEWRVQIRDGASTTEIFSTRAGDALIQLGPNSRSFDVTNVVQSLVGRDVELIFEQEDSLNYFNVALDDVRFVIQTGPDCHAPVANAGPDQQLQCGGSAGVAVHLSGVASTDADSTPGSNDDISAFDWFEDFGAATQRLLGSGETLDTELGSGSHRVTLRVTDRSGETGTDDTTVDVLDGVAPAINCPPSIVAECQSAGQSAVVLALASASDACSGSAVITNDTTPNGADASGSYPLGVTVVTFTATDAQGNSASCTTSVTVADTIAPTVTVDAAPGYLWPPNHAMAGVHTNVSILDACDPSPRLTLDSVVASEPDDAPGGVDGQTTDDIQGASIGTADRDLLLRAERSATGPGRTYAIRYSATDVSGNLGTGTGSVSVPHDRSGVVDPLALRVGNRTSTIVAWEPVVQALHFDVIRGSLDQLRVAGSNLELGAVVCLETNATGTSTAGHEDAGAPSPGRAFFYLVQFHDGIMETSYGEPTASKARVPGAR